MPQHFDKYPRRTNLGGIHILNPPEPWANTTNLNGVSILHAFAAGGCRNIPQFFEITVPVDPTLPEGILGGTHHLRLVERPLKELVKFDATKPLAVYLGKERIGAYWEYGPTGQITYDWVLYYGPIGRILQGPYVDGFQFRNTWWLVAEAGLYRNSLTAFAAGWIYSFLRPEIAENALGLIGDPNQQSLFDALQPNVFGFQPWGGGILEDALGGNQFITARPWYP